MSEDLSTEKARESTNKKESLEEKQQETIAALREQLAQANERDRENKHIIATLTQLGQAGGTHLYLRWNGNFGHRSSSSDRNSSD
jgi:hypothetical protein